MKLNDTHKKKNEYSGNKWGGDIMYYLSSRKKGRRMCKSEDL